jgi:tRNA pseudouridine55 synthase
MNGLLLINKPTGMTSFDVIRRLRRQTGVRKIGHTGTLDPMATGLMLMLFGTACKQAQELTKLDKRYIAQVTLGANSSTGDAEGQLEAVSGKKPELAEVERAVAQFTGEISQTPPVYSAIKINGQEAYKHARAGRVVEMPSRLITVYESRVLAYAYPVLELESHVSSGTYIRTLAQDIGGVLGTGAYLSGLVRTQVGSYRLEEALVLDEALASAVALHLRTL